VGKKEGGQGRDKEEEEASRCCSTESSRPRLGKQEVARSTSREPPRSSSLNSTMKTRQRLQKGPLTFQVFLAILEQH
jgi:hypothetical protein